MRTAMLRRIKKPLLEQYHVRLWACTGITEHGILGWAVCYRKWNTFFMWADSHIEIVNGYKYSGVYLDKHLNFNEHCDNIYNSAGRALGKIMLKFAYFRNVGYKTFQKIFESNIEPLILTVSQPLPWLHPKSMTLTGSNLELLGILACQTHPALVTLY